MTQRNEVRATDPREDLLSRFSPDLSPWIAIGQELGPDALERVLELLDKPKCYVPQPDTFWQRLEMDLRDARIRAEHNGRNTKELGERYGLDPRHIRRIVGRRN